ncbi:DUF2972 domain-containing protein, partial [Campylobacter jejuni]|nr:DUF2972 domain-containing protein [Campylobacter jejuni]
IHQTMYGICKKFKFDLKANFNDYADQIYTPINALLPFTLHIRDDIKLVITTYHKNKCDNIKNYIDDFCNFKQEFNVVINITDRELNILKQDKQLFKNVRKYVNSFIEVLEQKIKEFESRKVTEIDILEWIKQDQDLILSLKEMFERELICIKQHRPDIVASWKYYQEFEKM